jgi:endonuclease/exonuclease/phosphatase family metal-dependent hydrolase
MSSILRSLALATVIAASLLWLAAPPPRAAALPPCMADEPPAWCHEEPDEDPVPTPTPTPGVPPAAPTDVSASRSQDQALAVAWQDVSPVEDGYRIDLRRADGGWTEVVRHPALAGGRARAVVPVPATGHHCIRIRAVNADGTSASVEGCADTTPPKHRVSVLTLNLVGDDEAWDDGAGHEIPVPWRDRYERVARWMQSTGTVPDVLTLQEVYGVKLGLWDYETLFVLIDRIRARTGVGYRIAHLATRRATNTIRSGLAVLYNPARLRNTTPPVGDLALPDDHPFEPLSSLHGRTSFRCTNPPAALPMCGSIDGAGGYWTASFHNPASGRWQPGPTFSSFELLAEPGSHVHVYNVHAPLDAQFDYFVATRRVVAAVESRWSSRARLYPPLITGDFNATLADPGAVEFMPGGPFADFDIAGYSVHPDEIGILKGLPTAFPSRALGGASAQVLPVPGPKAPNCGTPAQLWSDHCGVLVELDHAGALAEMPRPRPAPDPGPLEPSPDPAHCLRKPYLPECGGP